MDTAPMKGLLQLLQDGIIIDTIMLQKVTTVFGREKGDVVLEDTEISSKHCQIQLVGEKYHLFDLNSTNGTFVNSVKVLKAILEPNDLVRIGKINFVFQLAALEVEEQVKLPEPEKSEDIPAAVVPEPENRITTSTDNASNVESSEKIQREILELLNAEKEKCVQELVLILYIKYANGNAEVLNLTEKQFTIGRLSEKGLFEKDEELSRSHARISILTSGDVELEDLGSTNGTFVNELQVMGKQIISFTDIVRAGSTVVQASAHLP